MLPNFFILGAEKAATTFLARRLSAHPDVFLTPEKELHFFNTPRFERGLEWYESCFRERGTEKQVGEATPTYLSSPEVPQRMLDALGSELSFLVSLRHPVDRAYSAFWHYTTRGHIPAAKDFRTVFLGDDVLALRQRGCYASHLECFFERFPRERFLVLVYESWKQNAEATLQECAEFLGLDAEFVPDGLGERANSSTDVKKHHSKVTFVQKRLRSKARLLPEGLRRPVMRAGRAVRDALLQRLPTEKGYEPLDPAVRQELADFYRDEVRRLEDLLGRDLDVWKLESAAQKPEPTCEQPGE